MKRIFCVILVLISQTWSAQNDSILKPNTETYAKFSDTTNKTEKSFVEFATVDFNVGFSMPSGDFSSGDYTNQLAGYAKEGYSLGANFSVKINKTFNLMFCYSRQQNVFDEQSFEVNALKGTKNYTLQTNANWKNHFALVGASGNIYLDEENILTPRLLVGMCLSKSPKYETFPVISGSSTVAPTVTEGESDIKVAVRIGVGLKKNLNKHFFFSINPDFYYSKMNFNINKAYFPNSTINTQSISIMSLSLSIGFRMYR